MLNPDQSDASIPHTDNGGQPGGEIILPFVEHYTYPVEETRLALFRRENPNLRVELRTYATNDLKPINQRDVILVVFRSYRTTKVDGLTLECIIAFLNGQRRVGSENDFIPFVDDADQKILGQLHSDMRQIPYELGGSGWPSPFVILNSRKQTLAHVYKITK